MPYFLLQEASGCFKIEKKKSLEANLSHAISLIKIIKYIIILTKIIFQKIRFILLSQHQESENVKMMI
jgi:hypothetical protein